MMEFTALFEYFHRYGRSLSLCVCVCVLTLSLCNNERGRFVAGRGMCSRRRYGVLRGTHSSVKDVYLLPVAARRPVQDDLLQVFAAMPGKRCLHQAGGG